MKFPKVRFGILAASTAVGAAQGFMMGTPGHRKDYMTEGALLGATVGTGIIIAPKLAKWGAGKAKSAAGKGYSSGKVMFRRIRGRIVPVRSK